MRRFLLGVSAMLVWFGAHLAYFAWYQHLLALPFTATAALFALLFAGWSLALLLSFRFLALRTLAFAAYALMLGWSIVDFAYAQVFEKFLPFSFSRAGSLNLAMLDLLKDYLKLLPLSVTLSCAALFLLGATFAFVLAPVLTRRHLAVAFFDGSSATYARPRSGGAALALFGILMQAACVAGAVHATDAYRNRIAGTSVEQDDILGDLGIFGYAIAAERGKADLDASERAADASSVSGLGESKTTVEAARDALDALMASSPRSSSPVGAPSAGQTQPNVIVYQMESVDAWALEQEPSPMPFLESLIAGNGHVGEYFSNGCDTIDAELAINCGFLPETNGPVSDLYAGNQYRCLPSILKDRGYATAIYHANDPKFWARETLAPAWGFEEMHFTPELSFREPDAQVFDRLIDDMKANPKPSYRYVVGFTSHSPHGSDLAEYYRKTYGLDVKPYAGALGATAKRIDADEQTVRMYLGFLTAVDDSLRHLFDRLKTEGLLENTIVVAFGDHRYYDSTSADPVEKFHDYNRIPFFIAAPGLGSATLAPIASHVDVPSTVYRLIAGPVAGLPESFLGHDLFEKDRPDGAVTKCLGHASYYDGQAITYGDIAFNLFASTPVAGPVAEGKAAQLRSVATATDLALKRNDLGNAPMPTIPAASQKIRLDNLADTDGDGLSDLREMAIGTDPHKADTDGDGYSDGVEVSNGFNPTGSGKWVRGTGN